MIDPNLTSIEVELLALSSLVSADSVATARDAGVDELSFEHEPHAQVWKYLTESAAAGTSASRGDVAGVTGVELTEDIADAATFIERLVEFSLVRRSRVAVAEAGEKIHADPRAALSDLIGNVGEILASAERAHSLYFGDADRRLAWFDAEEEGTPDGLETGLLMFDEAGEHWRPGEVVVVQGTTGVGKSWFLQSICATAYWDRGQRVLFISPELTAEAVEFRLEPMIARRLGFELSETKLRRRTEDRATYARYLKKMKKAERGEWVTRDAGAHAVFTFDDVLAMAREMRPRVLAIDGFQLIRAEGRSWESTKYMSEALRGLAVDLGMTVFATIQSQRDAMKARDDVPSLDQAAYGMALSEAADRVIGIGEKRGDPTMRVIRVTKQRAGAKQAFRSLLRFEVDSGLIEEIAPEAESDGTVRF